MNELKIFESEEFGEVRTIDIEGSPLFNLKDISFALGYTQVKNGKSYLLKPRIERVLKNGSIATIPHGVEKYINEDGLYEFIFESKTEKARDFRKWVTSEVLPQIRKTGGYIPIQDEDSDDEIMAKALMIASKTIEKKDELIQAMKPKVDNYDRLLNSDGLMTWEQFVKSANLKIGRGKFMDVLRFKKVLLQNGRTPYQSYTDRDYFEVKQVPIPNGNHVEQTFITRKGLDWLMKKCKEWDLFKEVA